MELAIRIQIEELPEGLFLATSHRSKLRFGSAYPGAYCFIT
ncbi:MAG: hypothetical protein ABSH09_26245 [Bryobacteraceae bacterium]|jgi:hypothetical protein